MSERNDILLSKLKMKQAPENKLNFDEILSTVSLEEMMQNYPQLSKSQMQENNTKNISADRQKFYLAYYAKATFEHIGFDKFSSDNQQNFKSEIEKIYADIKEKRPQGEFLQEMAERTAHFIEDRHFEVGIGEKTIHGGEKPEKRSVGSNFFYEKNKPETYKSLGEGWCDDGGEHYPLWQIGEMKKETKIF